MLSNEINVKVITPKGERNIKDLYEGDYVINYLTGEPIKVVSTACMATNYHTIIYSDNRCLIAYSTQLLFTGDGACDIGSFKYNLKKGKELDIPMRSYNFKIYDDNLFDPYFVGMLYAYGIWDKDLRSEVKLPCDPIHGYNVLGTDHINGLMISDKHKDYIKFIKHPSSVPLIRPLNFKLRYSDIIYKEYEREYLSLDKRPIPSKYLYSTEDTRIKFLSGIFNFGEVDIVENTGEIILFCDNEFVTKEIQKLLRSLGVANVSRVNTQLEKVHYGHDFQIRLPYVEGSIPRFIYDIDIIKRIINERNTKNSELVPYFKLKPLMIKDHDNPVIVYNIQCEKPHQIFTTANFLPMVSL